MYATVYHSTYTPNSIHYTYTQCIYWLGVREFMYVAFAEYLFVYFDWWDVKECM